MDELDTSEDLLKEVPTLGLGQLVSLRGDALEELATLKVLG